MQEGRAIVIGAGPAGLACAAALQSAGFSAIVLEKADVVASSWRRHYDRLHLHTHRRHSGLPGLPMPSHYPAYPSRDEVVAYFEAYAAHHRIAPRFGTNVTRVLRVANWTVETDQGAFAATNVVFATGFAKTPVHPDIQGVKHFAGRMLHSRDYANANGFRGQKVLVVGFGNSGGEIALDLADAGVDVAVSVRSPVNVVPRDLFGLPIQIWAILQRPFPLALVDAINAPIQRMKNGDLTKYGLRRSSKGPMTQIAQDRKIPLIDVGTINRIKQGRIAVRLGLSRIDGAEVVFEDGTHETFDAIIFATGYRADLSALLPDHGDVLDAAGAPLLSGRATQYEGLFFCGYVPASSGQLREIGREAVQIARAMSA
ncbi:flavin-containing monooxygenase [Methylovirgula sp. 4M-Z18]|uniref:flavin-containing monooxygenase n=1 Tax=Methylovirgula sp. 4M-Z18 TaxID=2293567 RepID=UPI000E2E7ABA|nr:NAD(P)/FAD-dependent oxidoreductase [Methylovirgula sp. 4M-Z18]RFB79520.1 NAD(P)/FAD-dependent oxidoreductase [Methylovirgula sp. 4M-Z18]